MSILLGPELFWLAVYFTAAWFAGRNVAPAFPVNDALSWLYWLAPSAATLISFWLSFHFKIPGPPTWWILVRLALAAAVGVCFTTSVLAEKIEAGSGRPGLAMGVMVAIGLHLIVIAFASLTGLVLLIRTGGSKPLWAFVKQGGIAAAVVVGLVLLISFAYDRQTGSMSGDEKAQRLSRAHGDKIGAKFPGEWKDGHKNWNNFEITFIPPNSVRLTSKVKYGEHRKPRDIQRHLDKWNGDVGAAFLEFIGAKRPWRATWDPTEEGGQLVWQADLDMQGLSKNQFLNDTAEAARLYIGPMSGWAGTDTWWLFGEAIDDAIEAEKASGSKAKFALAWLQTSLGHAAMYYERAKVRPDRLQQLKEIQTEARSNPDAAATKRLLARVREVEGWKHIAHAESDYAFLLNGSQKYLGLARAYAEHQ
jgi:hypothetical protein